MCTLAHASAVPHVPCYQCTGGGATLASAVFTTATADTPAGKDLATLNCMQESLTLHSERNSAESKILEWQTISLGEAVAGKMQIGAHKN